jgi:hypothetical protein
MTLPAAYAPISLGQIQGEFGGANPIALGGEYYRGGPYTTNNNTNVPTGGTIALSNFYSAWRGILVTMYYSREAANTNYFYLSASGFPTIVITTPYNGSSQIDSYIAPNVTYSITSNTGNNIQAYYEDESQPIYNEFGDFLGFQRVLQNGMFLEDGVDGDYNDLQWYPGAGTVYQGGDGGFYYVLNV